MLKIKFYGAIDEIGGNKILVEDETGARVFLDFGRRMGYVGEFFAGFLKARNKSGIRDLIKLNVIPKIDGIYRESDINMDMTTTGPAMVEELAEDNKAFEGKTFEDMDVEWDALEKARDYWTTDEVKSYDDWIEEHGEPYIRTGDIGRFDDEGFLYILDRKKDMIVTGGANVFASDIEDVLLQHPGVYEAAVIAVPHPKWIETPLALIRPAPGAEPDVDKIREWVNERVGKVQRVNAVEIFDGEFPRNALGKLLKRQLREPYWQDE